MRRTLNTVDPTSKIGEACFLKVAHWDFSDTSVYTGCSIMLGSSTSSPSTRRSARRPVTQSWATVGGICEYNEYIRITVSAPHKNFGVTRSHLGDVSRWRLTCFHDETKRKETRKSEVIFKLLESCAFHWWKDIIEKISATFAIGKGRVLMYWKNRICKCNYVIFAQINPFQPIFGWREYWRLLNYKYS